MDKVLLGIGIGLILVGFGVSVGMAVSQKPKTLQKTVLGFKPEAYC